MFELRMEIEDYYHRQYNSRFGPEREMTVTCGVTEGMSVALRAFASPGDKVLVFEPYHELYPNQCALSHLEPIYCPLIPVWENDVWEIHWECFDRLVGECKVVIVYTPHNPTGKVFSSRETEIIIEAVAQKEGWIITDEIYDKKIYHDNHRHHLVTQIRLQFSNSIVVFSIRKNRPWPCTGWRVGWVIHPAAIESRLC